MQNPFLSLLRKIVRSNFQGSNFEKYCFPRSSSCIVSDFQKLHINNLCTVAIEMFGMRNGTSLIINYNVGIVPSEKLQASTGIPAAFNHGSS